MNEAIQFIVKHGSVFILHPNDEVPAIRGNKEVSTIFKHGNIKFGGPGDNMRIGFVF